MTLGGLITAVTVWALTGSVVWGVVGLVGFGVFANSAARSRLTRVEKGDRR
jgi:hypothetical protein